jgi:hypothetical protein
MAEGMNAFLRELRRTHTSGRRLTDRLGLAVMAVFCDRARRGAAMSKFDSRLIRLSVRLRA